MRSEFASIGAAFDLIPSLTTTGLYSTTLNQVGNYTYTLPAGSGTLGMLTDIAAATAPLTAASSANATAIIAETTRAGVAEGLLAPKLNPTITGMHEIATAMAANNIDCNAATIFTKTISGATTLTVSNVPASGISASFILELTNGGSAVTTWWSGVKWAAGTPPALSVSGVDVLGFYTINGGTTWRGLLLGKGMA